RIQALRDWFDRLTERERRIIALGGVVFIAMVGFLVFGYITTSLSSFGERNADMRQALKDLDSQRDAYRRAKSKSAEMKSRLQREVRLQSYLEQCAKDVGIEIPESNERQPAVGKQYTERAVELRIKQVKLETLTRFLKKIETGQTLAVVTAL